ncbi:dormancy-associated protein 1-like [Typha latifolia]|uniref:dormancy-associated protein 1-like n=1 Tax=Typha latifolia TaxID=4733 RepID=UPI003C2C6BEE
MVLGKMWDDVVAGPQPETGLEKLRKLTTKTLDIKAGEGESSNKYQRSMSMPATPGTPSTPTTPSAPQKSNVWRSVFNPGSNLATKTLGSNLFDKPQPNSPTVYDWLYSGETRSTHR